MSAYATKNWLDEIEEAEMSEVREIERAQSGVKVYPSDLRRQEIGQQAYVLEVATLSPQQEIAMRMYATGQLSRKQLPEHLGVSSSRCTQLINSKAGQQCIAEVRGELEHRFQAQFEKVLDVIDDGLVHPEPSVALAAANMWMKNARASKVEVRITAEDLIGKIMSGEA
jgi:hypothetical protein